MTGGSKNVFRLTRLIVENPTFLDTEYRIDPLTTFEPDMDRPLTTISSIILFLVLVPVGLLAQEEKEKKGKDKDWRTYDAYKKLKKHEDSVREERNSPERIELKDTVPGTVRVYQDPGIDSLIQAYRSVNEEFPKIEGFRVQLYFGELERAKELRSKFKEEFEDVGIYIDYLAPNFRLRAGDFLTKLEAYRFLEKVKGSYTNPYIVKDRVEPKGYGEKEESTKEGGGE